MFGKLQQFWKSDCARKWKLRVYESMVASVLFFGPESVVFTAALEQRVDYFEAKCIRNILKVQAAYYSKVSNKAILEHAFTILYDEPKRMRPFSKAISDRAITLLGRVICANDTDQVRNIAIDAAYRRVEIEKKRVGRPRFFWLQTTMSRADKPRRKQKGDTKREFDIRIT